MVHFICPLLLKRCSSSCDLLLLTCCANRTVSDSMMKGMQSLILVCCILSITANDMVKDETLYKLQWNEAKWTRVMAKCQRNFNQTCKIIHDNFQRTFYFVKLYWNWAICVIEILWQLKWENISWAQRGWDVFKHFEFINKIWIETFEDSSVNWTRLL